MLRLALDALHSDILNPIANTAQAIPTDYDVFKKLCLQVEFNANWSKGSASHTRINNAQHEVSSGGAPAPAYSAGSGSGIPMDIDRNDGQRPDCHHCGKIGHISRNCRSICQHCKSRHPGARCPQTQPRYFNRAVFTGLDFSKVTDEDKEEVKKLMGFQ